MRDNQDMAHDNQHNPNPDENAAQIVAGPDARAAADGPTDRAAAWCEWSRNIKKIDDRALAQLRAAFEAGFEAGSTSTKGSTPEM